MATGASVMHQIAPATDAICQAGKLIDRGTGVYKKSKRIVIVATYRALDAIGSQHRRESIERRAKKASATRKIGVVQRNGPTSTLIGVTSPSTVATISPGQIGRSDSIIQTTRLQVMRYPAVRHC